MKRTGPQAQIQTNEEIEGMINDLPDDALKQIFLRLDWAKFASLGEVSKLWRTGVYELSKSLLDIYFPYLATLPAVKENPLKVLLQESRSYQRLLPAIEIDLILAALSGNREAIAAIKDHKIKIVLYALFAANHHTLPDGLTQGDIEEIREVKLLIDAFNAQLEALKKGIATSPPVVLDSAGFSICKGILLKLAASRGHSQTVTYVLSLGSIALEDKRIALGHATANGHLEVVKCLTTLEEISAEYKEQALGHAAAEGYLDVVEYLATLSEILPNHKGWALECAAHSGHLKVVEYLAKLTEISTNYKGEALNGAAAKGHLEVVEYLAILAEISPEEKGRALKFAADGGHLEVVEYLAALAEISSANKGWALKRAALSGHLKVVKFLLVQPAISVNDKQDALQCAQVNARLEIVAAIRQNLTMPSPASPVYIPLQAAVIASANNPLEPNRGNNNQQNAAKGPSSHTFS